MNTSTLLPPFPPLLVPDLAASLRDVTNADKFYWLLAILAHGRAARPRPPSAPPTRVRSRGVAFKLFLAPGKQSGNARPRGRCIVSDN